MALLALIGGILLAAALVVRELQLARERTEQSAVVGELQSGLERTQQQLRRLHEDLFVLQTLLAERNLLDEAEVARGRVRLVENPKRVAAEKEAIVRRLGVSPNQLVIDEGADKIH